MKLKILFFILSVLGVTIILNAQPAGTYKTESGKNWSSEPLPLDDYTKRTTLEERRILPYAPVQERDIMWETKIWQIIDGNELLNKTFTHPDYGLGKTIVDGLEKGALRAFTDEKFKEQLAEEDLSRILFNVDSVWVMDVNTYRDSLIVVENELDFEKIKRFRVKETWFIDSKTSTLKVRILGIAPLIEVYDDNGSFRYEKPMFWIHYPESRGYLARQRAYNPFSEASRMSWEDLMEMRMFSSYITKESNIYDRRIQDYKNEMDALLEADKIKNKIFNFEQDLWSY